MRMLIIGESSVALHNSIMLALIRNNKQQCQEKAELTWETPVVLGKRNVLVFQHNLIHYFFNNYLLTLQINCDLKFTHPFLSHCISISSLCYKKVSSFHGLCLFTKETNNLLSYKYKNSTMPVCDYLF